MSEYRFHLEKYRYGSKIDCPNCGRKRCFVRYIDEEGTVHFPSSVGKCDHEQSCGYHYTPREYFRDNSEAVSNNDRSIERIFHKSVIHTRPAPVEPSYIPDRIVRASLSHYDKNPLYRYLCGVSVQRRLCGCSIFTVSAHRQSGAALRYSGRRTNRGKSARGRLCCTIRRRGGASKNRKPVSAGHTRNYGCRTSICDSVCSASTCFRYIPTGQSFWSRAKSPPLSLRTICRMSFGSLRAARTDASIYRLSIHCADAMLFFCPTSVRPMLGRIKCRCSSPPVEALLSVRCSKIWRRMSRAVRDSILPTFCLLFRPGIRYSSK